MPVELVGPKPTAGPPPTGPAPLAGAALGVAGLGAAALLVLAGTLLETVGAGAVGMTIGAAFAAGGHEVIACSRSAPRGNAKQPDADSP